jgi:hypothetical protein
MTHVEFPSCFHQISKQIGHIRGLKNKYNGRPSKYDRGNKNAFVDTVGVLGELIFLHYLVESKIEFHCEQCAD